MTKPFKIAIAGTHSTGKSTFASELLAAIRAHGLRATVVHDSAQDARDRGFPILWEHTFDSTSWLIGTAMRLEAEAALISDVVIIDRPVPDALGYLQAALSFTARAIDEGHLERLERVCEAWVAEYNLFFVTELDPLVPLGPGRDGNEMFRQAAARAVDELTARLVPSRLVLRNGETAAAVEEAVGLALDYFGRQGTDCDRLP